MGKKPIVSVACENIRFSSLFAAGDVAAKSEEKRMFSQAIVSVTYENERISIKNSLPYLKCVLRLSCVVHGPIYGRFMAFYVNGFLSI